jgi:hypothetical protein
MFKLYFKYSLNSTNLPIFSGWELDTCLNYIRQNSLCLQQCLIVTPNNRRVTFNQESHILFSGFNAA